MELDRILVRKDQPEPVFAALDVDRAPSFVR
jgi:hypothetical protein